MQLSELLNYFIHYLVFFIKKGVFMTPTGGPPQGDHSEVWGNIQRDYSALTSSTSSSTPTPPPTEQSSPPSRPSPVIHYSNPAMPVSPQLAAVLAKLPAPKRALFLAERAERQRHAVTATGWQTDIVAHDAFNSLVATLKEYNRLNVFPKG